MGEHQVTPIISVLIPCYRQGSFLDEVMASLREQTLSSWEAIIVAQDDDSVKAAAKWRDDERVIVLKTPALGVAAARNAAAQASQGKFLLPLDADDLLLDDALNKMAVAIGGAEHAIAYSNLRLFGVVTGEWCPSYDKGTLLQRNCLPNTSLHTKALWEESGGWEEALPWYEDWAYWVSCSRFNPSVTHIQESLVLHREWGKNASLNFAPWHNVYSAMLRTLYPLVYGVSREDRIIIANEGSGLLPVLREKLSRYPKHAVLQEWVALIEGKIAAR